MMWKTIQVFYYDEQRHGLLVDAIRPAVEALQRQHAFERFWFESHWKFGPHVNLNFQTDPERFERLVLPQVRQVVGDYLAKHPSTLPLDPAETERRHQELALLELEVGPFVPLQPNNSIQVGEYRLRDDFWGSLEAAELGVDFRCDTVNWVFDLIDQVRDDYNKRLELSMGLMLATVGANGPLRKRHMCYRSHFEGLLGCSDPTGRVRRAMEEWYEGNERWLSRTLKKWYDMVEGRKQPNLMISRWLEVMRDYHQRFQLAFEQGGVKAFKDEDYRRLAVENTDGVLKGDWSETPSDYHRILAQIPSSVDWSQTGDFHAFRYTVNCTYNWMIVLGITPLERFFLCYAIARYAETYYGKTWWEIVYEGKEIPAEVLAIVQAPAYAD